MGKLKVTDFFVYKWRYALGSFAVGGILFTLLFVAGLLIPGGLAEPEMTSAVKSSEIQLSAELIESPDLLIHLPYHLLQKLSIAVFGVTTIAIKLPSLVLGFASALFIFGVLNLWFRRNVAVITTIILATSGAFLLQSQLGSPEIMYLFWTSCLLFCSSMLTQARKSKPAWTLLSALVAGLSLYSPFAVYGIIALGATALIHPHARFVVFRQSKLLLTIGAVLFLSVISPILFSSLQSLDILIMLVGIPDTFPTLSSVLTSLQGYVNYNQPTIGVLATPVYGLVVSLLVVIGLLRLFTAKYTAKSYILTIWIAFIVLVVGLADAPAALTFVPIMLLVAFAIDYLIRSWYKLFPRNPYARVTGLFPLGILLFGITTTGIEQYVLAYHYAPEATTAYSHDLQIVRATVAKNTDAPVLLLVQPKKLAFYELYAQSISGSVSATASASDASTQSSAATVIASRDRQSADTVPTDIIVTGSSSSSDRFYLYKNGYN